MVGDEMQPTGIPRLILTQDNEFFFQAARELRLEIQRCVECEELRHPPAPCCASCNSFEWDSVEVAPKGSIHTYTIAHRPQDSAFTYPHAVALVDLEAGVRIVADVIDTPHDELAIDLPVEVVFTEHAHGEILPSVRAIGETK